MKFFPSQFSLLSQGKGARRNFGYFFRVIVILAVCVAVFSVFFHYIMEYEGREYSWITGLYWTLTVMSTLGFGDITFNSDLGRFFSIVVLLTGIVGLRPRADRTIEVNPLVPEGKWDWFCLDNVLYHGRNLTILWDKDGSRYHMGKGLRVLVDGKEVGHSDTLSRLVCPDVL